MQDFSPESKIWIYQASRALSDSEMTVADSYLQAFCRDWTAHNQQLIAGAEILYRRFIVLKVDETHTGASGCSIDKSVRALKELSARLDIDLFNRTQLPYMAENEIRTLDFNRVEQALEQQLIVPSTPFFDLNVRNLGQFREKFLIPLSAHWAYPKI